MLSPRSVIVMYLFGALYKFYMASETFHSLFLMFPPSHLFFNMPSHSSKKHSLHHSSQQTQILMYNRCKGRVFNFQLSLLEDAGRPRPIGQPLFSWLFDSQMRTFSWIAPSFLYYCVCLPFLPPFSSNSTLGFSPVLTESEINWERTGSWILLVRTTFCWQSSGNDDCGAEQDKSSIHPHLHRACQLHPRGLHVVLIQFAFRTDHPFLSNSCADFINPRIFGLCFQLPLFLALFSYVLHRNLFIF